MARNHRRQSGSPRHQARDGWNRAAQRCVHRFAAPAPPQRQPRGSAPDAGSPTNSLPPPEASDAPSIFKESRSRPSITGTLRDLLVQHDRGPAADVRLRELCSNRRADGLAQRERGDRLPSGRRSTRAHCAGPCRESRSGRRVQHIPPGSAFPIRARVASRTVFAETAARLRAAPIASPLARRKGPSATEYHSRTARLLYQVPDAPGVADARQLYEQFVAAAAIRLHRRFGGVHDSLMRRSIIWRVCSTTSRRCATGMSRPPSRGQSRWRPPRRSKPQLHRPAHNRHTQAANNDRLSRVWCVG